jgi:hypothetical protein
MRRGSAQNRWIVRAPADREAEYILDAPRAMARRNSVSHRHDTLR